MRRVITSLALVCATSCGGSSKAAHERPTAHERPISVVTSAIVLQECPASMQVDSKRAREQIAAMVVECQSIPGGKAHFSATLMPDGRVQFGSPSGDPSGGVIPTCLLQTKTPLRHKLRLSQSCKLDVQLEETQRRAGA